jgi:hypothetical protein
MSASGYHSGSYAGPPPTLRRMWRERCVSPIFRFYPLQESQQQTMRGMYSD